MIAAKAEGVRSLFVRELGLLRIRACAPSSSQPFWEDPFSGWLAVPSYFFLPQGEVTRR